MITTINAPITAPTIAAVVSVFEPPELLWLILGEVVGDAIFEFPTIEFFALCEGDSPDILFGDATFELVDIVFGAVLEDATLTWAPGPALVTEFVDR